MKKIYIASDHAGYNLKNSIIVRLSKKQKIIDHADHFICISKNTQKDLIKYYGIEEKKTSVIYLSSFNKQNSTIKKHLNIKPYFLQMLQW